MFFDDSSVVLSTKIYGIYFLPRLYFPPCCYFVLAIMLFPSKRKKHLRLIGAKGNLSKQKKLEQETPDDHNSSRGLAQNAKERFHTEILAQARKKKFEGQPWINFVAQTRSTTLDMRRHYNCKI